MADRRLPLVVVVGLVGVVLVPLLCYVAGAGLVVRVFHARAVRQDSVPQIATVLSSTLDLGDANIRPLLTLTGSPRAEVRRAASDTLCSLDVSAFSAEVRKLTLDPDPFVSAHALVALAASGDVASLEQMVTVLHDEPFGTTRQAIVANALVIGLFRESGDCALENVKAVKGNAKLIALRYLDRLLARRGAMPARGLQVGDARVRAWDLEVDSDRDLVEGFASRVSVLWQNERLNFRTIYGYDRSDGSFMAAVPTGAGRGRIGLFVLSLVCVSVWLLVVFVVHRVIGKPGRAEGWRGGDG